MSRFAALERARCGPSGRRGDRRLRRRTGPAAVLDERVADCADPVVDCERGQPVAVPLLCVSGPSSTDVEPYGSRPRCAAGRRADPRPAGPYTVSGSSRPLSAKVLSMPGRPRKWSAWRCVRNTSSRSTRPDVRAQELPLGALRAVDEQPLAAAPDQRRGRCTLCRRRRPGRPEEHDVEVHGGRF